MAKILDWDRHIGRHLKLRDLHVFFTVVEWGSLAKAATHLRVSQPAVSQLIADLEHALGVKLVSDTLAAAFAAGHWVESQQPFPVPNTAPGSEPQPDVAVIPGSPRQKRRTSSR